ncbi:OmpA family protein [Actinorugispora endophytica]|uniref:Outer membrane protein OmpA-like peptidoglycan-associated protein n=1 Tax=Actinorugispora endophytica TaxID=1605990 RepID=A0A4R6V7L0_9ACTN|nr:OmpA family protein [Actinorugispora endophytica]TDQ55096.1 outer membrane protein OmpA-like peptidoglycan-associated protein [Actinorugispora endophytica]
MRVIRRLGALLFTLVLLLGLPYVLLWHLPWPDSDLTWNSLVVHLSSLSLPPGLATAFLVVTLWALWGLYAVSLAVEFAARGRGRARRFRPLGPLQIIAATAIGGSLAAPTQAFADTVVVEDVVGVQGVETPDTGGDEAQEQDRTAPPSTGEADGGTASTERVRTLSGFTINSASLTDGMREDLEPVVDLIREHGDPEVPVLVTGHTDRSGSDAVNLELSERRAQSVADHLAAELGEEAPEIEVEGVGSEQLLDDADVEAQRRVEVTYAVRPAPPAPQPEPASEPASETASEAGTEQAAGTAVVAKGAAEPDREQETAPVVPIVPVANTSDIGDEPQQAAVSGATSKVVVLEVPAAGALMGAAFAGVVGGFVAGRRGGVRKVALALPRGTRALTAGTPKKPERRSIDASPRPLPGDDVDGRVIIEISHIPGIGITGPGARAAARRLIANALSTEDERSARVLITKPDVLILLGSEGQALLASDRFAGVRVVETMHDALTILQRELHDNADQPIAVDDRAPLVLIATPTPEHEVALSGLLLHGQERGISAVLLGRWPLGGSCVIEADGLITETSPPLTGIFHAWWPGCDATRVNELIRGYSAAEEAEEMGDDDPTAIILPVVDESPRADASVREAGVEDAAFDSAAFDSSAFDSSAFGSSGLEDAGFWGRDEEPVREAAREEVWEAAEEESPETGAARRRAERTTGTIGASAAWDAFTSAFEEEEAREADRERALRAIAAPRGPSPWKRRRAAPEPVAEEAVAEPVVEEPEPAAPVEQVWEAEVFEPEPVAVAEPVAVEQVAEEAVAEPVVEEPVAVERVFEPVAEEPVGEAEEREPSPVAKAEPPAEEPSDGLASAFSSLNQPSAPPPVRRKPTPKRFRAPTPHSVEEAAPAPAPAQDAAPAPARPAAPAPRRERKPVAKAPRTQNAASERAADEAGQAPAQQPLTYRPRKAGKPRMRRPRPGDGDQHSEAAARPSNG